MIENFLFSLECKWERFYSFWAYKLPQTIKWFCYWGWHMREWRPWDSGFILNSMLKQFKRLDKEYGIMAGHYVGQERDQKKLKILICHLDRIIEDNFYEYPYNIFGRQNYEEYKGLHDSKYYHKTEYPDGSVSFSPRDTEEAKKYFANQKRMYDRSDELQKYHWQRFNNMFNKYMKRFWI